MVVPLKLGPLKNQPYIYTPKKLCGYLLGPNPLLKGSNRGPKNTDLPNLMNLCQVGNSQTVKVNCISTHQVWTWRGHDVGRNTLGKPANGGKGLICWGGLVVKYVSLRKPTGLLLAPEK